MWMCRCFWIVILLFLFFFKQKTAYEMRISDWSSDVCSSDLHHTPESPASPGCEALLTPESTPAESPPGGARRHCSAGAPATRRSPGDRKSGVSGTSVSVRVDLGGRSIIKI